MKNFNSLYKLARVIFLIPVIVLLNINATSQDLIQVPLNFNNKNTSNIKLSDYMYTQEDWNDFKIPSKNHSVYFLKKYVFDYGQSLYFRFLNGKLTQQQFDSLIHMNHIDTSSFPKSFDNSTLYVLGKKVDNEFYEFIPDMNFNKDFTDDEIFRYQIGKGHIEFSITLEGNSKNKKIPVEYAIGLEINTDKVLTNEKEEQFPLSIIHFQSFSGLFYYQNKKYMVEIFSPLVNAVQKSENIYFMIFDASEMPETLESKKYLKKFYETYEIGNNRFKIKSIDLLNLQLTLSEI